ncbi:MAG: 4Fe-4S dicluster domain-containing protein [Ruminococcaceae bacterium]|nr:4Fe-4S dicluster domain-containing protein [Oscillospiraceae bacterium]
MIVYFTGTGNSRYCAEALGHFLEDEVTDSRAFIKNGIAAELISDKPWVFVGPVYAWQMAHVFEDFIRSGSFEGSRDAYFLITCGGSIAGAGKYMEKLCKEKGLNYMGTLPVVMPENYVAMFAVPDEDKSAKMIRIARKRIEKYAVSISEGKAFEEGKKGFMDKFLSGAVNTGFYKGFVSAKKFYTTDKCIACGKCVELCPLNNISIVDGKVKWGGNCTHCMACISYCPTEAIEYGKASIGKRRYRCEKFSVE